MLRFVTTFLLILIALFTLEMLNPVQEHVIHIGPSQRCTDSSFRQFCHRLRQDPPIQRQWLRCFHRSRLQRRRSHHCINCCDMCFPCKLARPPHRHWLGVSCHTGDKYRAYHQPVLSGQLESRIFFLDTPLSLARPDHAGRSGGLYRLPTLPVETDTASGDCGWLNNIICGSFCCSYSLF
jgi:hypothetical protein